MEISTDPLALEAWRGFPFQWQKAKDTAFLLRNIIQYVKYESFWKLHFFSWPLILTRLFKEGHNQAFIIPQASLGSDDNTYLRDAAVPGLVPSVNYPFI